MSTPARRPAVLSGDAAVRHLLRHLRDPVELRENPIAAALLVADGKAGADASRAHGTVLEGVRSAARALGPEASALPADVHGARQRAIITGCEIEGRSRDELMRELAISRSEFYLERQRAIAKLAILLSAPREDHVAPEALDEFAALLENAATLGNLGQVTVSTALLRDLAANRQDAGERARALLALAMSYGEQATLNKAERTLEEALRSIASLPDDAGVAAHIARAEADAVRAWLSFQAGKLPAAIHATDAALAALTSDTLSAAPSAVAPRLYALLNGVAYLRFAGRPTEALGLLDRAAAELLARDVPVRLKVHYWGAKSDVLMALPRPLTDAEACARSGLALALRHGSLPDAAVMSGNLCAIEVMRERHEEAWKAGQLGAQLAAHSRSNELSVLLEINRARAKAGMRHWSEARMLLHDARGRASGSEMFEALCDMHEAEVLLESGEHPTAERLSRRALSHMRRFGAARYVGALLSVRARLLERLGRVREARDLAQSAVETLERYGTPWTLARAYEVSGRLKVDQRHSRRARDLYAAIQA